MLDEFVIDTKLDEQKERMFNPSDPVEMFGHESDIVGDLAFSKQKSCKIAPSRLHNIANIGPFTKTADKHVLFREERLVEQVFGPINSQNSTRRSYE